MLPRREHGLPIIESSLLCNTAEPMDVGQPMGSTLAAAGGNSAAAGPPTQAASHILPSIAAAAVAAATGAAAAAGVGPLPGLPGEGPRGLPADVGVVDVKPPLGTGTATAVILPGVNAASLGVLPGNTIPSTSVGIPALGNRLIGDDLGLGAAAAAAAAVAPSAAAGGGMGQAVYSMPILSAPTLPEAQLPVSGMPVSSMGLHQSLTTSLPLASQSVLQSTLTTAPVSRGR